MNDKVVEPFTSQTEPLPRFTEMKRNWRSRYIPEGTKFDDDRKLAYCDFLARSGRRYQAACAAGVCMQTVRNHMKEDEEFAALVKEAEACWRDRVMEHAADLFLNGVEEPIVSKGEVVAYKTVYPIRLLELELKRVEPGYREKSAVDHNVRGGVLVAPARVDGAEWDAQFAQKED